MAAAHISDARIISLACAMLTLLGYEAKGDAIGGTMTPKAAIDIFEAELVIGESEMQTDMEPFFHVLDTGAKESGPYKELLATAVTGMKARAVALA
jgi:hypothetical protein